jgi:hypothetical protein
MWARADRQRNAVGHPQVFAYYDRCSRTGASRLPLPECPNAGPHDARATQPEPLCFRDDQSWLGGMDPCMTCTCSFIR